MQFNYQVQICKNEAHRSYAEECQDFASEMGSSNRSKKARSNPSWYRFESIPVSRLRIDRQESSSNPSKIRVLRIDPWLSGSYRSEKALAKHRSRRQGSYRSETKIHFLVFRIDHFVSIRSTITSIDANWISPIDLSQESIRDLRKDISVFVDSNTASRSIRLCLLHSFFSNLPERRHGHLDFEPDLVLSTARVFDWRRKSGSKVVSSFRFVVNYLV